MAISGTIKNVNNSVFFVQVTGLPSNVFCRLDQVVNADKSKIKVGATVEFDNTEDPTGKGPRAVGNIVVTAEAPANSGQQGKRGKASGVTFTFGDLRDFQSGGCANQELEVTIKVTENGLSVSNRKVTLELDGIPVEEPAEELYSLADGTVQFFPIISADIPDAKFVAKVENASGTVMAYSQKWKRGEKQKAKLPELVATQTNSADGVTSFRIEYIKQARLSLRAKTALNWRNAGEKKWKPQSERIQLDGNGEAEVDVKTVNGEGTEMTFHHGDDRKSQPYWLFGDY